MELYTRIRMRREELGLSQTELAHRLGYKDRSTIAKIEAGINDITQTKIAAFAKALQTTPGELMGWETQDTAPTAENLTPLPPMKKIPLVGQIACGVPILAEENISEYIDLPTHIHADYALTCKGNSMIGAGIQDGDVVYIRKQNTVENGQIAAVITNDNCEATLKRFYRTGDTVTLSAENPAFAPMVFVAEDINNLQIVGIAVAYTHVI